MALALESLTFSVETKELENAIQKIKELGQAASSLNKPIEQLGKQASEAGKKVEKAASASEVLAAGSTKAKTAADNLGKSQEKTTSSAAKMQALIERLSNTYMDLSNGMTRGESNILNAARSFGALEAQLEPVRKVLEQIKELSKDPFDAAIGSVRRISQEFEQFKQRTDLANQGIYLSTKQLQEYSKIASEIKGKLVSSGVKEGSAEYQERFASMLAETNKQYLDYVSKLNSGLAAEQARNKALAEQERLMQAQERLLQQNATAMDEVAKRWKFMQSQKAEQERNAAIKEQNRLLAQGSVMMDDAVNKFKAGQLAKEQEKLNEQLREQNRLMQQGATAMDSAVIDFYNRKHQALNDLVKAEQSLVDQEQRLQFVTQKTSEGFTVASANSLYRYEQSLKKAGVTEQEFINRSSAYATALKARQDVSDTNARRKAATEELIRIEKQLEDQEKFLAYATAEFSKQQQQATAGNQNFADSLNMGSLRALFNFEQELRRAGAAEIDVANKSEVMRGQLLRLQQAANSFNGSVNHLGRNVGVQFTDIFVSLYNGQPIMQVITQQGGQLADAFLLAGIRSGDMTKHLVDGFKQITESYKMLAAAFAGLIGIGFDKVIDTFTVSTTFLNDSFKELMSTTKTANSMNEVLAVGFNKLTVAVTALGRATALFAGTFIAMAAIEFLKADLAMEKLNKTLIQFGAALGITAQQGEELAVQIGTATTASIGSARDAILAFAKEGVDVTTEAVTKAVELNEYLGISFEESAKKAAQFKNEPVDALIEMAKKTGEVDLETLKYVASLELAGDRQGAIKAAIEAKDKAETAAINRAKVGLSGLSELWLTIKHSIVNATDETIVFLTTSKTLRSIYAGIGAIINTLLYGTAQIYEGWRAIFSVLSAAATGSIDNINASLAESARRMTGVNSDATKLYEDLYKFATADAEANNDAAEATAKRNKENSKSAGVFQKELSLRQQLAKDLSKADADKLTRQQFINASIDEEMRKLGFVTKDQEILNALTTKYGEEWDKANKKAKQSQAKPKTSFSTNVGNTIVETSKQFEQRLQLEQRLTQDQLATLENYYKDGLNSKGKYLAQEVNIVTASREKQLQILEQYNDAELAAFAEKEAKLRANAATAIAKGGDAKSVDKQLQQNLADLAMQKQTFNEKITGKQELAYSAVTKILSKSLSEVSKSTQEVTNDVEKFSLELAKQQVSRQADIQFAAETIGMSEKEIAVLKAKMQVQEQYNKLLLDASKNIAESESTFWEFVQGIDPMNSEALDKAWAMWQGIHKAKMKLTEAGIEQELAQRTAMQDAALEHDLANYKRLQEGVADAITSGLLEGGEEGKKKLRDIIVAELRKPITLQINAFVNSVLSDVIGLPGNNSSEQGTNSGILGNLSSLNSAYKLINNSISSSITKGFSSFATSDVGIKMGIGTSNTSAVGPVKPGLTSTGTAVNSALTMAGNAIAGYGLQKSISGGYKTGESGLVDAATVIASAIYGPLAGVAAGVFNRAFGRKLKDQGLEGTFGTADGFDGNAYQDYKGGWFRSDKTKRQALDAGVEDALETQFKALQIQTALMAQTLGLGVDSVANFTAKIKVSFKGLSEEQISERMTEEFGKIAESMARGALGTTEYTRTGETAVETMTRLYSSLTTVNGAFDALGQTLYASTLSGADMASQLVDLMGGLENFTATTASYYNEFYSETERTEVATRQLTDALASIGVDTLPATREAFRSLVEAQDLTTESGRETYAGLLGLHGAFAALVPVVETIEQAYQRLTNTMLTAEQVAEQRISLEERLFNAIATTAEAAQAARNAIDPLNQALYDQVVASEMAKAAADERLGLESQLLQAVGDSAAIRAKERSVIDSSNLALFDLVKSFEDLKDLSSQLDTALSNAASAAEKVKSIQDKATSNYVQAQDKVAEAQKKIKDIQNENLKQQIEKAKELSSAFSDLSKSLKDFVYGEIKPSSQLFTETLKKALNGNQDAMKELPDAATAAIEQAKNTSGTLEEYERKRAEILAGVLKAASVADRNSTTSSATATSLEAKLTPEQTAMQQAQNELADALKEQKDALKVANAISASLVVTQEDLIAEYKAAKAEQSKADTEVLSLSTQLTNLANATAALAAATGNLPAALAAISINAEASIKSAITMATASDLPAELKQIALASLNDLQSNFKVVSSNKSMPAEVKQVAMAAIASSSSNFGVIAKSTSIPAEVKQIALGAASAVTSNINTVVTQAANGTIPASIAKLALGAEGGISTTITTTVSQAETGKIPESIAELVLNSVNGLSTDVTANVIQSGSLDDASKAIILSATDDIAKTFNVTVQNTNGNTVPAVISNLALKTNEQLAKSLEVTVALAKGTTVPPVISNLAGATIGNISRTISTTVSQAANGKIPESIAKLVLNSTEGLSTNVIANVIQSGSLDDASKAIILSATDDIAKTFNVTVELAKGATVPTVISNLALKTNEQLAKSLEVTVALAKDKTVPAVISTLAGTAIGTISRTISTTVTQAAKTTIPQEIATLAGTTTDTIGKTIDVTLAAVQAGAFPTWVTELALNSTNNAAKTVEVAVNQAATNKDKPWITHLKLLTGDVVGKTVEIAMGGDPTLTPAQAALKITSADNLLKTVDLALSDSKLTAEEQELITSLVQNVDGTINIEGGSGILTALDDISLNTGITAANTSSEELAKVIEAKNKLNAISQRPQELRNADYEIIKRWEDLWNWTKTDGVEFNNGIYTWEQFRERINQGTWWERDKDFSKVYGTSFDEWYAYTTRLQNNANNIYNNWQSSITQATNELNAAKQRFGNDSLLASMGFSSGGYTGDGGKYQPAGIVHAGEVVFSQSDISKLGGVGVVEGIRTGEIPMFANGGIVKTGSPTSVQVTKPDNSELVQELQSLREEVKMLRAEARATAMNTSKTARILDDVTQGGTEVKVAQTEEFTALFVK